MAIGFVACVCSLLPLLSGGSRPLWRIRVRPRSSHPRGSPQWLSSLFLLHCSLLLCFPLLNHLQNYEWRQEFASDIFVMLCCMMFRPIVRVVRLAGAPVKSKLLLALAIAQPVESHVHCLCSFWLHFAIDDPFRHGVVRLHRSWRLLVSHFFEDDAYVDRFARHDV